MIPSCDHTGTPRHFHSSTTSGSACLTMARIRASISPRQSPSSLIRPSICFEGEAFPSGGLVFFAVVVFFMVMSLSHALTGQAAGLFHPIDKLRFVKLIVFVDVEIACVLRGRRTGRDRTQRRAAKERHFDVFREDMQAEKPTLVAKTCF